MNPFPAKGLYGPQPGAPQEREWRGEADDRPRGKQGNARYASASSRVAGEAPQRKGPPRDWSNRQQWDNNNRQKGHDREGAHQRVNDACRGVNMDVSDDFGANGPQPGAKREREWHSETDYPMRGQHGSARFASADHAIRGNAWLDEGSPRGEWGDRQHWGSDSYERHQRRDGNPPLRDVMDSRRYEGEERCERQRRDSRSDERQRGYEPHAKQQRVSDAQRYEGSPRYDWSRNQQRDTHGNERQEEQERNAAMLRVNDACRGANVGVGDVFGTVMTEVARMFGKGRQDIAQWCQQAVGSEKLTGNSSADDMRAETPEWRGGRRDGHQQRYAGCSGDPRVRERDSWALEDRRHAPYSTPDRRDEGADKGGQHRESDYSRGDKGKQHRENDYSRTDKGRQHRESDGGRVGKGIQNWENGNGRVGQGRQNWESDNVRDDRGRQHWESDAARSDKGRLHRESDNLQADQGRLHWEGDSAGADKGRHHRENDNTRPNSGRQLRESDNARTDKGKHWESDSARPEKGRIDRENDGAIRQKRGELWERDGERVRTGKQHGENDRVRAATGTQHRERDNSRPDKGRRHSETDNVRADKGKHWDGSDVRFDKGRPHSEKNIAGVGKGRQTWENDSAGDVDRHYEKGACRSDLAREQPKGAAHSSPSNARPASSSTSQTYAKGHRVKTEPLDYDSDRRIDKGKPSHEECGKGSKAGKGKGKNRGVNDVHATAEHLAERSNNTRTDQKGEKGKRGSKKGDAVRGNLDLGTSCASSSTAQPGGKGKGGAKGRAKGGCNGGGKLQAIGAKSDRTDIVHAENGVAHAEDATDEPTFWKESSDAKFDRVERSALSWALGGLICNFGTPIKGKGRGKHNAQSAGEGDAAGGAEDIVADIAVDKKEVVVDCDGANKENQHQKVGDNECKEVANPKVSDASVEEKPIGIEAFE